MKKVILIVLSLILLTGCGGLYNLNDFVLPDNPEFLTLIKRLDTPEKIVDYMKYNFQYEVHVLYILTPYELYITGKGDCDDFSTFGIFVANYHGYETWQIKVFYEDTVYNHSLAVYKEDSKYNFSDNQQYFPVNYNNFYDIVQHDSRLIYYYYDRIWTKYIVYDYRNNIVEETYNN
jgi:hypothetical protein